MPVSGTAAAGTEATLSVAVFRKAGTPKMIKLVGGSTSPLFEHSTARNNGANSGTGAADEIDRRRLLAGCSYVLALPAAATTGPKWLKIVSSWTNPGQGTIDSAAEAASRTSWVSLDLDPLGTGAAGYIDSSGSAAGMWVVAFENLIRVDQYTVSLE